MLHLLYGPDEYSSTADAAALAARLSGTGDSASVIRLDGATCSWTALREACMSVPMFTDRHVVMVRGLLGQWSGRADSSGAKQGTGRPTPAELVAFIVALPSPTELILHEGELTPANRYLKEISGLGSDVATVRLFAQPQGASRQTWIGRTVRARGGSIDPGAAALLAERSTGDLRQLSNEIDKLLTYTAPLNSIMRADVELLVPESDAATGFELVDAVTAKDQRRVVDLAQRLLSMGQAPEQVLALLGARIRDLSLLAAAQAEDVSGSEVAARSGWSPGRLTHLERNRRQFSAAELAEAQSLLVAADLALKSRPGHERPLVTLLTLLAITQRRDSAALEAAFAY